MSELILNTFAITARCKETGMLGVAISTARPGVGGLTVYVKAGVGAIASKAAVNPYLGIDGLTYLEQGLSVEEVMDKVRSEDPEDEKRQFAIVDHNGNAAAYTGSDTVPWAGHYVGDQFVVSGNMLVGKETIDAMKETFEATAGDYFPERLLAALAAGQEAGGDKRGKQSAALYVAHKHEYPLVDLRVDEHQDPVTELQRVYDVWKKELLPYVESLPVYEGR